MLDWKNGRVAVELRGFLMPMLLMTLVEPQMRLFQADLLDFRPWKSSLTTQGLMVSVILSVFVLFGFNTQPCYAYTPKDPAVRHMVDRGAAYLATNGDARPGAMAVLALALLKADRPVDHPQIRKTVEMIRSRIKQCDGNPAQLHMGGDNAVYSIGTSTIFLLALDPVAYRQEIDILLEALYVRQKGHGGWGYSHRSTGDTSMTQYAVLSLWEAHQAGISIPPKVLEDVAKWLLKTQDPSGAFAYQGKVSSTFEPIKQSQSEIRISMAVAGLGSLYICSDLMGYVQRKVVKQVEDSPLKKVHVPIAIKPSHEEEEGPAKINTAIDVSLLRRAQESGNRWMAANFAIPAPKVSFTHYYLYALERYGSFRELDEGKLDAEEGPAWYNEGVEYLMSTQNEDGSWRSSVGKPVDTAFAMLFLLRSTKKRLQGERDFGPGTLVGGRGFPKDGRMVVRNGRTVVEPISGPFEAVRAAMDKTGDIDLADVLERIDELGPKESEVLVSEYAQKLRELLSDPLPGNRIAAVKALGRSGQIENVPMLILALDDEDTAVVLAARDSLRRLTRKLAGFGLSDDFTPSDRRRAVREWRAWYKELQPDAEF